MNLFSRSKWKYARRQRRDKEREEGIIARRATALGVLYQDLALNCGASGVARNERAIVVSLTTFDKRIHEVYLTIESLFQQSRKADRVVLWLSAEECAPEDLPQTLKLQMQRGLEVRFCSQNLRSYNKFFHALEAFPDSLLLTVDDDLFYPPDMIDQLYLAYCRQPEVIHCHRAHRIELDAQGQLLPYKQWQRMVEDGEASLRVFPTGIGGVLYFPGCFDDEIANSAAFARLAPTADDVWLKAMSLKRGTLCRKLPESRDWGRRFILREGSQAFSLKRDNKHKRSGNDPQLRAVFEQYQLLSRLRG